MVASFALALLASFWFFGEAIEVDTDDCVASDNSEEEPTTSSSIMQKSDGPVGLKRVCKGVSSEHDATCEAEKDLGRCWDRKECTVSRVMPGRTYNNGMCVGKTSSLEEICRGRDPNYCKSAGGCVWKPKPKQ
eukprot:TRINITY_DN63993_c0_g1_i1.p1 TRINITY_DN63993_c0_g1~~TRINITY_DN63993_c0_g1_i1.p1  ORF type:complete len:133 (+),score=17.65 TRINITY_DN63993_c0_g1_i1:64-462(+)